MSKVQHLEWGKPMQKNFCIPCISVAGVLSLYVRKTRYDFLNESDLKIHSPGIQNRRVQTPFLTAKFILKNNDSIHKAVNAIHQLEVQEKVRSETNLSVVTCSRVFYSSHTARHMLRGLSQPQTRTMSPTTNPLRKEMETWKDKRHLFQCHTTRRSIRCSLRENSAGE